MPVKLTLEEMLTEVRECMGQDFKDALEEAIDNQRADYGQDRYDLGYSSGHDVGSGDW